MNSPEEQSSSRSEWHWHKALERDELAEGRVTQVTCDNTTVCLAHFQGKYAALDNQCPHQGGPLGEGSIENGLLRCPWHGWDFHPVTGKPPGGFDDGVETYEVDVREDGIYVGFPPEEPHQRTVSDLMVETMVNWGVKQVFGMVGHSNLGLADAFRIQEEDAQLTYYGIRHEGAAAFAASAYGKLTGRPAACFSIAGPGATNLLTGLWDANVDRSPTLALTGQVNTQVLGPGAFQEIDVAAAYGKVAQWSQPVLHDSNHAELMNLACKSALVNRGVSHLIFPDEVQNLYADDDTAAGSPEGRITEKTISPPESSVEQAVELQEDISVSGLNVTTSPNVRHYLFNFSAYVDPFAKMDLKPTIAAGVIDDSRKKANLHARAGLSFIYRFLLSSPFSASGSFDLPFDLVFLGDDSDQWAMLPVLSPRIGVQSNMMLSPKHDLMFRVEIVLADWQSTKWRAIDEDNDDSFLTNAFTSLYRRHPAVWSQSAPEIQMTGVYFSIGLRFFHF